jgi:hypothetical protein
MRPPELEHDPSKALATINATRRTIIGFLDAVR